MHQVLEAILVRGQAQSHVRETRLGFWRISINRIVDVFQPPQPHQQLVSDGSRCPPRVIPRSA